MVSAILLTLDTQFSLKLRLNPKCQPRKMLKHTQAIRRFLPTNRLSAYADKLDMFDRFVGLALNGLIILKLLLTPRTLFGSFFLLKYWIFD